MSRRAPITLAVSLFLLAPSGIVHCPGVPGAAQAQAPARKPGQAAKPPPQLRVHYGEQGLPRPVLEMREAMLAAIHSGRIENLREAYELSGPRPDIGAGPHGDPVAHWKKISGDGEGREVLAALSLVLEAGYVVLPLGADLENNRLYIWPYFAEIPLDRLTPPQQVELLRLVPPAAAGEMRRTAKYTHWRLVIGADGAWHSFRKGN
jgi:hypothetical protein